MFSSSIIIPRSDIIGKTSRMKSSLSPFDFWTLACRSEIPAPAEEDAEQLVAIVTTEFVSEIVPAPVSLFRSDDSTISWFRWFKSKWLSLDRTRPFLPFFFSSFPQLNIRTTSSHFSTISCRKLSSAANTLLSSSCVSAESNVKLFRSEIARTGGGHREWCCFFFVSPQFSGKAVVGGRIASQILSRGGVLPKEWLKICRIAQPWYSLITSS
mmetsp:Transcript_19182/g.39385  ORF Transcript_19182/g.39385 Transcript_19182/m.39385 type:complete len:212 (-) Transcript_19182:841-1476(-)